MSLSSYQSLPLGDSVSTQLSQITTLDSLSQHGINMADIERVKSAGINTIKGLRMCTSKRLAAIKGISDAKVEKMKEAARKLDGHEFVTGFEYAEQRKEFLKTL